MIIVKLLVLLFCVDFVISSSKYCQICPNHTLCKYTMPGPSSSCKEYEAAPLTKDDVHNIINKINEARNFVATGLSRLLPQAANMNKIYWSDELAAFAQRWVDQCDSSTRPDKEDECRDLVNATTVFTKLLKQEGSIILAEESPAGQNIVTITGSSPGMHLTSLIDVWFMQKRDYSGSVSYYNQSRDWKTNHFTQLIWADTDKMGCGRAKFYVDQKQSIFERLVCNFAPRGNIHGKPVYAIGYPATQCQNNKAPDSRFKGLCSHWMDLARDLSTPNPPVSSLLRILNLSNNSVKLEIDPIRNNIRQTNLSGNGTIGQRNQKTRHVFFNNSNGGLRKAAPLPMQNQWNAEVFPYSQTPRSQKIQHYQQDRGHSRVYHGHDLQDNTFATHLNDQPTTENFRKFDYSDKPFSSQPAPDLRKYNRYNQCTRRPCTEESNCHSNYTPHQCTRTYLSTNCLQSNPIATPCPIMNTKLRYPHGLCQCNTPRVTCATLPPNCPCNLDCKCFNADSAIQCLSGRRSQNNANPATQFDSKDETRKAAELHYYDLLPNMGIRSGEGAEGSRQSKDIVVSSSKDTWFQHDTTIPDVYKHFSQKIRHEQKQVKEVFENKENFKQEHDYMYDSSDSRERKKRSPSDEATFKPFWQMDEYNRHKSIQLKSVRYTTLSKKKHKQSKQTMPTVKAYQTTESITIQINDKSITKFSQKSRVTEKYLSFDELMHLRKLGTMDPATDARRRAAADDSTTAATAATSEYTANTPFKRKKHCTRKLTCTWTAPTIVGADGSVVVSGIGGDRGSRTPPGYVEGCTRTSTCTRDFMDRNKFSTIQDESSTETSLEDEDYCEKRALNVRRRDSNLDTESYVKAQPYTEITYTNNYVTAELNYVTSTIPTTFTNDNCVCNDDNVRLKRNNDEFITDYYYATRKKRSYESISYGDLYYLVLQKIIQTWKKSQNSFHKNVCPCNSATLLKGSLSILLFIFLYDVLINVFI